MPKIAIQVALYHSSDAMPKWLAALKSQTVTDWKIFAYENSCDPSERGKVQTLLEQSGLPFHLMIGEKNLGFESHNALFRLHDAEFVLVLNDDAYLEPNYLEICLARFAADPSCASVTGLVYRCDPSDETLTVTDATPVDTAGLEYRCLGYVLDRFAGEKAGTVRGQVDEPVRVFGVSCAAAMFRRSHLLTVSPEQLIFAPHFFMYKEDIELALRLTRYGFTSWFEPHAVAFHERGIKETSRTKWGRILEERKRPAVLRLATYRNQWRVYFYHFRWALGLSDIVRTVAAEFQRSVLVFVASPSLFLKAWGEILRDIPAARRRRIAVRTMCEKKIL